MLSSGAIAKKKTEDNALLAIFLDSCVPWLDYHTRRLAQFGRALALGVRGRRFKSCISDLGDVMVSIAYYDSVSDVELGKRI